MTMAKQGRAVPEPMRRIEQPGPPEPERIQWVEVRGRAFAFTLPAGRSLLEAARRGFAEAGFAGGVLSLRGGAVEAFGIDGAAFTAEVDRETNFKLFGPVARAATNARGGSRAFALRLRPNQDFATALENFCRQRGIFHARIHGGVGSTIGAHFSDGRKVVPFATELAVRAGSITAEADGTLQAAIDVALVDYLGGVAEGRLMRGDNPVLMTMELVLEVL